MGNGKTGHLLAKRLYYRSGRMNKDKNKDNVQSDIADEFTDTEISLTKYRSMSLNNLELDNDNDNGNRSRFKKNLNQLQSLEEQMVNIELSLDASTPKKQCLNKQKNSIKIINNVDKHQKVIEEKIIDLENSVSLQKEKLRKLKDLLRSNESTKIEKEIRTEELKLLLTLEELNALKKLITNTTHLDNSDSSSALFNCIRGYEYVSLHTINVPNYNSKSPVFDLQEKLDCEGLWVRWARSDLALEYNDRIIEVNGKFFIGKSRKDFIDFTRNCPMLHLVILRACIMPPNTVGFLNSLSTEHQLATIKADILKIRNEALQNNMIKDYLWDENLKLAKRLTMLEDRMVDLIELLKKGPIFKKNSSVLLNNLLIKNHNERLNNGYVSDSVSYKREKNKKIF